MTIYKLEENLSKFISTLNVDDKFLFLIVTIRAESDFSSFCVINLRVDKLFIHGTEIKEPLLQKLQDSLRLRPIPGYVFVNGNGSCYICPSHMGVYRTIDNNIFDWSRFGVIVPNSVNDISRNQLQVKDKELASMSSLLSCAKDDALANKDGWEASKEELKEIRKQLLACQNDGEDVKLELKSTKFELEISKERVIELEEQLVLTKKESDAWRVKFMNMEDRVSLIEDELKSTKIELESSKKNMKEVECQLSSTKQENQVIIKELENDISTSKVKLQSTNSQLESFREKNIELEEQVSSCLKESKAKEEKLIKVQDQLNLAMDDQVQSMKIMFEFAEAKELEDQCLGDYVNQTIEIVDE